MVEDTALLPHTGKVIQVTADKAGYVTRMNAAELGISALLLGAGRSRKEDTIDPAVGYWMKKRLGDEVAQGEPLAEFHVNSEENLEEAIARFKAAIEVGGEAPEALSIIYSDISS